MNKIQGIGILAVGAFALAAGLANKNNITSEIDYAQLAKQNRDCVLPSKLNVDEFIRTEAKLLPKKIAK